MADLCDFTHSLVLGCAAAVNEPPCLSGCVVAARKFGVEGSFKPLSNSFIPRRVEEPQGKCGPDVGIWHRGPQFARVWSGTVFMAARLFTVWRCWLKYHIKVNVVVCFVSNM